MPVQLAASPLHTGDRTSICLVASDLTELEASAQSIRVLREHQQALEESEARFRTMFEASQDAIVITDDAGVYVQANPAVAVLFGLPPEQLLGRKVSEFLDDTLDFSAFWRAFLINGSFHGELGVIDAQGQRHDADFSAVTNVLPGRHMAVVRDITERKQAQHDLEEMNYRLQVQAEELEEQTRSCGCRRRNCSRPIRPCAKARSGCVWRSRRAGSASSTGTCKTTRWSGPRSWKSCLAIRPALSWARRRTGPSWCTGGPPADELVPAGVDPVRAHGGRWEYRFIRADGQVRWMAGRGRIFRDPSGKPLRLIGTNVDITERKRAEAQLQKRRAVETDAGNRPSRKLGARPREQPLVLVG